MEKNFSFYFDGEIKNVEDLSFFIPTIGKINVISSLKRIERTGKKLRFEKYGFKDMKVRSIFDHMLSLGRYISAVSAEEKINCDERDLAVLAVYHDLCEAVIGDYPEYSKKYDDVTPKRNRFTLSKDEREVCANDLLRIYANEEQACKLKFLNENTLNQTKTYKIFKIFDETDPLIAIWRYIYTEREKIGGREENFISATADFFDNPKLKEIAEKNEVPAVSKIIVELSDKGAALDFLKKPSRYYCKDEVTAEIINKLITQ